MGGPHIFPIFCHFLFPTLIPELQALNLRMINVGPVTCVSEFCYGLISEFCYGLSLGDQSCVQEAQ
ncbi:hypothetical protein N7471_012399 [Penicillium samsonianum]|uniref:uncharacterized protein n=1 Tax=Penicillium samsonianum TaxID=1882272 RepID=UPI00254670B9|nr:uncharacterized protein N7471_012399 [Penicillium samsonianum]KAJ6125082.1 hypothetical protein N7471_012399 [Penicillium samsonianum]